jgi:exopolysaccharide production protein ExoQ
MSRGYYWISGFFLLAAMQAFGFIDRLVYGEWVGKPGDKITQSLNLLLILASLALFARRFRGKGSIGIGGILAIAAAAFLLLTAFWSFDPSSTVREAVVYLFVVLGAMGIAGNLSADEYMDLLSLTCFLSAIASLVLLVVSPSIALSVDSTDFQGIFAHKNFLGQVMVTGALASLHAMRAGRGWRPRHIFMLFVFAGMALASKSATSWLTIFAFCCVDAMIAVCRRGGVALLLGIFFAIVFVPMLIFVAADPDPVLEIIGKDPSLTGRTEIWAFAINEISLKPLLGWGYFAFWSVNNPAAMAFSDVEQWFVPQAHNGLLEMLLNIGAVGTAIFVLLLVRNVVLAFRCLGTPAKALAISTLLCCAGIMLVGVSEAVLLVPTQPSTSVFFITGLMCEQALRSARGRRYRITPRGYPQSLTASSAAGILRG